MIMKVLFKIRTIVAITPMLVCLLSPCSKVYASPMVFLLGIVCFTLGLAIRIWAQQHLGYRIPKKYRKAQRKKLVTTGPYRLCRNPVYIGNILIITGLPLMAGAPHVAPLSLVWSFLTDIIFSLST